MAEDEQESEEHAHGNHEAQKGPQGFDQTFNVIDVLKNKLPLCEHIDAERRQCLLAHSILIVVCREELLHSKRTILRGPDTVYQRE